MSVQYDRARCVEYVYKVKAQLCNGDLARFWVHIAFDGSDVPEAIDSLLEEWQALSLWEQQSVLYMLAPVITEIATNRAHDVSQQAREEEPL